MVQQHETITLIVGNLPETEYTDRKGGQTQGLLQKLFGHEKPVDLSKVKQNLDNSIAQISSVLSDLKKKAIDGWELESVSISLAVSAEGSIGVATAGVEAAIEVSFKPKH